MSKVLAIAVALLLTTTAAIAGEGKSAKVPAIDKSLDDLLSTQLQKAKQRPKKNLRKSARKVARTARKIAPRPVRKKLRIRKLTPAQRAALKKKARSAETELLK